MPSRMIREGNLDSARLDALSEQAELFYRRLWSVVDDYGRFENDSLVLLAKCWPRRIHRYTPDQVTGWVAECASGQRPLVVLYEVNGKHYLEVQEFDQRIRKDKNGVPAPSRYPAPPPAAAAAAFPDSADFRRASRISAARATSAAATATATADTKAPAAQQQLWPETAAVVQELHPGADVAPKLAAAAAAIIPSITDCDLRDALLRTHRGKRQQSAGLWLTTVPEYLRGLPPPRAGEQVPELCDVCHEPGLCECRQRALAEMLAPKPPGAEVRSIGEKTRRGGAT